MAKPAELTMEIFQNLLSVLSSDPEEAGRIYEQLRAGLIRFFYYRGCSDAEVLADETINRVAAKLDLYDPSRSKISSYFYGFASNVLHEYRRRQSREQPIGEMDLAAKQIEYESDENLERLACLRECTTKLKAKDAELIKEYYGAEGSTRKAVRNSIGLKLGLSVGALHTRVFRLKVELRKCVEKCLLA